MLSNIASYFFGGNADNADSADSAGATPLILSTSSSTPLTETAPPPQPKGTSKKQAKRENSEEESDWVMVGEGKNNQANLGSLNEAPPRPQVGSEEASQDGDMNQESVDTTGSVRALSRSARRLTAPLSCCATTLAQLKGVKSAQNTKKKEERKSLSAKATEKRNKAVKNHNNVKAFAKNSLAFKASGVGCKQLKQC